MMSEKEIILIIIPIKSHEKEKANLARIKNSLK